MHLRLKMCIRDRIMGAMNPVMSIILNIGLVLVLFVGAKRVNEGLTTPGVIMAFMSYVTIILNSILFLSRIFVMYSKASASARRISEVLNLPEDLMVCLLYTSISVRHVVIWCRAVRWCAVMDNNSFRNNYTA